MFFCFKFYLFLTQHITFDLITKVSFEFDNFRNILWKNLKFSTLCKNWQFFSINDENLLQQQL